MCGSTRYGKVTPQIPATLELGSKNTQTWAANMTGELGVWPECLCSSGYTKVQNHQQEAQDRLRWSQTQSQQREGHTSGPRSMLGLPFLANTFYSKGK